MLGAAALGQVPLGAVPARAATTINNPPFASPGRAALAAAIVALWQPPDPQPFIGGWQPLQPRRLSPQLAASEVDNPPFSQRGGTQGAQLAVWLSQPDPWTYSFAGGAGPYLSRRVPPGAPGISNDPPPFMSPSQTPAQRAVVAAAQPDPWTFAYAGAAQPFAPRRLSPGIPGQSVDLPPPPFAPNAATPAQRAIVAMAQPDPWTFAYAGAWQPYGPRRLSAGTPGQSIDNPPFTKRRKIAETAAIVTTWEPPPPQPWVPRYQIKFFASFSQLIVIG